MEKEMNRLNEVINQKAEDKLKTHIHTMKICDIDQMDIHIILPDGIGYISTNPDTKGKRMVRSDAIISLIKEAIYKKEIRNYQENERKEFLNDLAQIKEYINS